MAACGLAFAWRHADAKPQAAKRPFATRIKIEPLGRLSMKKVFLLFSFALTGFALTISLTPAQEKKRSDSVVKVIAKLDKAPAGKAVVVLNLEIDAGWHLYANPVEHEDLDAGQVVVKVVGNDAAMIEYPKGKLINDKYLGKYKIYDDKIEIRATIDRKAGDTAPIELTVALQSCSDKAPMICLPPVTKKVIVP
jgi:DsbC/DsbD-like thiol-disulfide interchange protein